MTTKEVINYLEQNFYEHDSVYKIQMTEEDLKSFKEYLDDFIFEHADGGNNE